MATASGRVERAELVAEPPQPRPPLLRVPHHLHDLGVARIDGELLGPDGQGRVAVDRARRAPPSPAPWTSGTARRSGTTRPSSPWPSSTMPSTGQISCGKTTSASPTATAVERRRRRRCRPRLRWADGGHAAGQRLQDRRGAADGVGLQRLAAGEHEHDERAGQVLAEQHRRDDGDAGQQVGAEVPGHRTPRQLPGQWDTRGDQCRRQRQIHCWQRADASLAGWNEGEEAVEGEGEEGGDGQPHRAPCSGCGDCRRISHALAAAIRPANVPSQAAASAETSLPGRRGMPTFTPRARNPALIVPVGLRVSNIRSTSGRIAP